MIDPQVWQWLKDDGDVKAALGNDPRIYPFDDVPHAADLKLPYCVWQYVAGTNEFTLCGNSDTETARIQFDVYGAHCDDARKAAQAIEAALAPYGYTVSYNVRARDPETKNYRYSWDFGWIGN